MSARDSGGRERGGPERGGLVAPEHARKLLDEVVFERVLEYVDIAALFRLELQLWRAMIEVCPDPDAREQAKALIAGALRRVADNRDRYGMAAFGDCELCDEEAVAVHERRASGTRENAPPRRPS